MSGGHFDYEQYKISNIADEVENLINTNNEVKMSSWGETYCRGFSRETINEFEKGLELLRKAFIYAHRIDYLVSGDDGEDYFHKNLRSDLEALRPNKGNV
jgi:hypothetical protein